MDLGLRERLAGGRENRPAQMKIVGREVEIEKRRLVFLELRGGRQHVVRHAGCLGERHVDHDQQFELRKCVAIGPRVGAGHQRIAAFDHHGADPLGVIGIDLQRQDIRRIEAADLRGACDLGRASALAGVLGMFHQGGDGRVKHVRARLAEMAGEQKQELREIRVQRAVRRMLEPQIGAHASPLSFGIVACDLSNHVRIEARLAGVLVDRNCSQLLGDVLETDGSLFDEFPIPQPLLHDRAEHGQEQMGVAAGRTAR